MLFALVLFMVVLEGPVQDDDGIEHSLEEPARWGSISSAPVTSSATRTSGSLDEDLHVADEQGQRRLVEEAEAVWGSDSRGRATDVVEGSPPPTQKEPDHIGTTKPQTAVSCAADTGTTRHATLEEAATWSSSSSAPVNSCATSRLL